MNEAEQERIARAVLERAGGRENITKAYHCMTRLRLELAGGITEDLKAQLAAIPGVLVRQHGPFTWGPTPRKAVENAKVLDVVAEMSYHALQLTRADCRVPQYLLDKHYYRKHGAHAYYGQAQR